MGTKRSHNRIKPEVRRRRTVPSLTNKEIRAAVDAVAESVQHVDEMAPVMREPLDYLAERLRERIDSKAEDELWGAQTEGSFEMPPLSFESPESRSIQGARYDPDTRQLFITFLWGASPTTYRYGNIDPHLWEEFVQATSKGSFVSSRIRPMYTGEKVTS